MPERKGKKELERKVREEGGKQKEGTYSRERIKGRIDEGGTNLHNTYCRHHGQPTCQFGEQLCLLTNSFLSLHISPLWDSSNMAEGKTMVVGSWSERL